MATQILVDADGCPVVDETLRLARQFGVGCLLFCDTAHELVRTGAGTVVVSKGADSADFALVNRARRGDLVVTQDYGLAAMCLARGAIPLSQNGVIYSEQNIDALLQSRHTARKLRRAGEHLRGPKKRTSEQDRAFVQTLTALLAEKQMEQDKSTDEQETET